MAGGTISSQPIRSPHNRWRSTFGMMMAGEHHPRMSNNLAMPDINRRLVSSPFVKSVGTLGLKVSVVAFHSTPKTLVKCSEYLIRHDDRSSQRCCGILCSTVLSLVFHFLSSKPPNEKRCCSSSRRWIASSTESDPINPSST